MRKLVLLVAAVAFTFAFGGQAIAADAEVTFSKNCSMCHGRDAAGSAMAPALKGSDFVKGDADAVKATITNGRKGDNKKYSNFAIPMPNFERLGTEEIDALVAYLQGL